MKYLTILLAVIMLTACGPEHEEQPKQPETCEHCTCAEHELTCELVLEGHKVFHNFKCDAGMVVVKYYSNGVECALPVIKCK